VNREAGGGDVRGVARKGREGVKEGGLGQGLHFGKNEKYSL
jgi:hypothetical protein